MCIRDRGYTLLTYKEERRTDYLEDLLLVGRRYVIPEEGNFYVPRQHERQGYALSDTELLTTNSRTTDVSLEIHENDLGDEQERARKFVRYRYKDPRTRFVTRDYIDMGSEQSLGLSPTLAVTYTTVSYTHLTLPTIYSV